ncbi:GIY-YIG nuclease family protein [Psychrilyobacter atlanticus]|uniref:GIY-YIG nuclease family protein n=1 Tax=Psychrilyobacter atlanticus TaxID=271091 RepID=UPI000427A7D3|nr:GIY-YIG nuclease family protein [Psychrilyobacter atlanticus]
MYYIYMLGCGDGSVYTGITNDVEKRIEAHKSGEGAKYTRGRGPFELLSLWETKTKSQACRVEYFIKKHTKKKKILFYTDGEYLVNLIYEEKQIEIKKILEWDLK